MDKLTPIDLMTQGYRDPVSDSLAAIRVRRKQAEAAARFQVRPDYERALAWRDSGDPRWDKLGPSTHIALAHYEFERNAAGYTSEGDDHGDNDEAA